MKKSLFPYVAFLALTLLFVSPGGAIPEEADRFLVLQGARLIDGTGDPAIENSIIVIQKDRIVAVGKGESVQIPENSRMIDVTGMTVTPGFIDAHVHFTYPPTEKDGFLDNDPISAYRSVYFLNRHLLIGVTTVRDVASRSNVGIWARRAFEESLFNGSRPVVTGMGITCTGGHGTQHGPGRVVEADGPAEFRKAVRGQLKAGADMIKVLPPYSREEIRAAIEETHYYRRLITVHSGHSALMRGQYYDFVRWAVEEGADCIEHAFAIPDDVIATMAKKKTYCVPTLDMMLKIADKVIAANPDNRARAQQWLDSSDIFRKMKKLGVRMAVGTDAVREDMVHYPWMYFEEIERFVDHGYTEMEAIVAATRIAAEVSGVSDKLGTLQKGKIADLVVVEGNPLDDIRHLRKAKVIVQSGRIVKQ